MLLSKCKCPKCNEKMLAWRTMLPSMSYVICCVWCNWESKEYDTREEAINNYDNEVL